MARFSGGLLTLLAFYGLVVNAVPSVRPNRSWALAIGLYLWLAVNVVVLMDTPLPWQRYYLSLIPVMTLLCGVHPGQPDPCVQPSGRQATTLCVSA